MISKRKLIMILMIKKYNATSTALRAGVCKNEKCASFVGQAEAYNDAINILKDKKLFKELYKEAKNWRLALNQQEKRINQCK